MSVLGQRVPSRRVLAAVLAVALAGASLAVLSPRTADADTYPGLDDIAAAKAAVADQRTSVEQLDAAIVGLEEAASAAQNEALAAADRYAAAMDASDKADAEAEDAAGRAADAEASLDAARADLGAVAMDAYRTGGSMTSIEAIVGANGFDDVIGRSEAISRASEEYDTIVQKVRAAEIVAQAMSDAADDAAQKADEAEAQAATALGEAQDAQRAADQAVAEAEATRQAAVERLAQLQNTTVALEQQRQAGLAAERAQREREAYEAAVRAAEEAAQQGGGSTGGGSTGDGSTGGGSTPPAPDPTPTTPPPDSGTGGEQTGAWRSTAAQGEAAAAFSQTLLGRPYLLGGNGPAYDCSGLTYASWRSVGYTLSRSSQGQYNTTTHVPISQMRPGDLVFYGTNRDASRIYHVAIYIGNGLVAEATKPGDVSQIRAYDASWRIDNLIPYVGRP